MPANTPKYSLPYPLGTDRVADGDDAIKALAERVEAILGNGFLPWTPYVPTLTNTPMTVNLARYAQIGRLVVVSLVGTFTGEPTSSIQISAPKPFLGEVKAAAHQLPIGIAFGTGPSGFMGGVWARNGAGNDFSFGQSAWGPGNPFVWGAGSVLGFVAVYESLTA